MVLRHVLWQLPLMCMPPYGLHLKNSFEVTFTYNYATLLYQNRRSMTLWKNKSYITIPHTYTTALIRNYTALDKELHQIWEKSRLERKQIELELHQRHQPPLLIKHQGRLTNTLSHFLVDLSNLKQRSFF